MTKSRIRRHRGHRHRGHRHGDIDGDQLEIPSLSDEQCQEALKKAQGLLEEWIPGGMAPPTTFAYWLSVVDTLRYALINQAKWLQRQVRTALKAQKWPEFTCQMCGRCCTMEGSSADTRGIPVLRPDLERMAQEDPDLSLLRGKVFYMDPSGEERLRGQATAGQPRLPDKVHMTAISERGGQMLGTIMILGRGGCPFLKDGKCSIHAIRPLACRSFPWTNNSFADAPFFDTEGANGEDNRRNCKNWQGTRPTKEIVESKTLFDEELERRANMPPRDYYGDWFAKLEFAKLESWGRASS